MLSKRLWVRETKEVRIVGTKRHVERNKKLKDREHWSLENEHMK